ncbi:vancomycin high temperature exclusion protein [Weeksella virosa]|uniref:DUF218 domain-containing protein n=1 Tax=Weeksella virosa (strain ATCC 43766 / DSM 16922 / JCM 21250 / CCUG 30538 / CDC 9751 / IAM 14551 / NBRC 16016 / NCTC 11634 / CL345/78) TaxID=865938 RepID=F0P2C1_WEEVC|nr:ElyC/SanA/YdcF family protein [Weeksella virosa]ADX66733.1 protein of unknown function DUF218 [Weeksella virosa DSM 16922]VEH63545.1 vancomycin high temperature exclusion protein [Weeksella virosa]
MITKITHNIQKILSNTYLKTVFILSVVGMFFLVGINYLIVLFAKPYVSSQVNELGDDVRVAVVLGTRFNKNGEPSDLLKDRLDAGIQLFKSNKVDYLLLSGESLRNKLSEVDVMEKYCVERGVPVEKILVDGAALDTYSTVYRTKYIYGIKNPIFVTQEYHLSRTLFIGRMLNISCTGYPADFHTYTDLYKDRARELVSNVKAIMDVSFNRVPPYVIKERKPLVL